MEHLQIRVLGKVQGVWFRQKTLEQAQLLSISGYVQNQSDGSVFIEAEGDDKNLKKFLNWCQKGPDLAKVKQVLVQEGKEQNYDSFEIRED